MECEGSMGTDWFHGRACFGMCEYYYYKNSIFGDVSAINPGGVRLGTPALTTRGFQNEDFKRVADLLHEGCMLALVIKDIALSKKDDATATKVTMKEYTEVLENDES